VINRKEESQTDIAKNYGVTRAAVSKVIIQIKDELKLPTARHMKSDTARVSYRNRALRVHQERKEEICKSKKPPLSARLWSLKNSLMPTLVQKS
jgi:hypothetical protein